MVVLVLVVPVDAPAALLGLVDALPAVPAALAEAPVPALAPLAEGLLPVVVVVVVVAVEVPAPADRMSMNTTVSPLLARFRKVPATAGILAAEPLVAADGEDDVPVELELLPVRLAVDANDPVHWFWLSICW